MNFRRITFLAALVTVFNFYSCKDDEESNDFEERDELEVYNEDILEIEEFLSTHTYNYEEFDFDNPYSIANDEFKVKIELISEENDNLDKTPILNRPELYFKTVELNDIDYKLYILKVREGLGDAVHPVDKAAVTYKGELTDGTVFDQQINVSTTFNLTDVGSGGVVTGFRESLIEFKTRDSYTENPDNTIINHNHGIGASFVPSGIGYFSLYVGGIEPYTPLIFSFDVLTRLDTDYDSDLIPSHLEDLDQDNDATNDDTDGDGVPNFLDNDDDGDGVLTQFEDIDEDGDPTNDDTDNDGIPNYLDSDSTQSI